MHVVSIFPGWFQSLEALGLTGRALAERRVRLRTFDPRDYAEGVHRSVDDRPYGGGPGMVMRPEPLARAIEAASTGSDSPVAALTPQGRPLDQQAVEQLAARPRLILVCGRYEGIDERVHETLVDEEWSLGDFVLSGGELAAAALIDAVVRLQPGVLGHAESAAQDSFAQGLLDCPHYTRPEQWRGLDVPEVLRSGDHAAIARWRRRQALERTRDRRPDLIARLDREDRLDATDRAILAASDPD
ncbi:tRNA (guanosine(37)-N1)-methyltransferase TrmD [Wenzhouxiangella sp. XN79A]|uniref:tRNA (guanosine(37)-N1)-methyltransferase TrmD n=1 Tax=Wenzhouxiangella sp. XN79A TaxID=2724193 RepID=UPI00321625C3